MAKDNDSSLNITNEKKGNHTSQLSILNSHLNINQWAEEDRPREKLLRLGAEALSNAELLAILVGSGTPEVSAVELMKQVLDKCKNNLNTLGKMSAAELQEFKGVGPAKAITVLAACELGKRRAREKMEERLKLDSAQGIYDYMHTRMQDLDVEEAWALYMNQNYKLISAERISRGGISDTSVDVRIIMRQALLANATIFAVCHNHPSGNAKPSSADDKITMSLSKAGDTMRIYFLDHLIITDGNYYSYREEGRL
jgi:DNA repair protein RadC